MAQRRWAGSIYEQGEGGAHGIGGGVVAVVDDGEAFRRHGDAAAHVAAFVAGEAVGYPFDRGAGGEGGGGGGGGVEGVMTPGGAAGYRPRRCASPTRRKFARISASRVNSVTRTAAPSCRP